MATTPSPPSNNPDPAGPNSRPLTESQTLRDVRSWRKEAYEERQTMTAAENLRRDQEMESQARRLGLRVVKPEQLARPIKKAG